MTQLPTALLPSMKEYAMLKGQIDTLTKRANTVKADLMSALETQGEEDEGGHQYLELPEVVGGYTRIQRQRRISQKLDEDAADTLLTARGLKDSCYTLIPVLDEDEVLAAFYREDLSQEDLDTIFPKTVTWAFCPKKS